MSNDTMGAEEDTIMDTGSSSSPGNGKDFVSRRVMPDPLSLPYSRVVSEVTKEIILATYGQRRDLPKTATALERYNERNGRAATPDPAAVRGRIQGLLLDGLLTAFIRGPSGRIFRVSLHAFAHNSETLFEAMEQGRKITVPAMLENLIVDLRPTTNHETAQNEDDDGSGMITGIVFFYEDAFLKACAADPIKIEYTHQVFIKGVGSTTKFGLGQSVISSVDAVPNADNNISEPVTSQADRAHNAVITAEVPVAAPKHAPTSVSEIERTVDVPTITKPRNSKQVRLATYVDGAISERMNSGRGRYQNQEKISEDVRRRLPNNFGNVKHITIVRAAKKHDYYFQVSPPTEIKRK